MKHNQIKLQEKGCVCTWLLCLGLFFADLVSSFQLLQPGAQEKLQRVYQHVAGFSVVSVYSTRAIFQHDRPSNIKCSFLPKWNFFFTWMFCHLFFLLAKWALIIDCTLCLWPQNWIGSQVARDGWSIRKGILAHYLKLTTTSCGNTCLSSVVAFPSHPTFKAVIMDIFIIAMYVTI